MTPEAWRTSQDGHGEPPPERTGWTRDCNSGSCQPARPANFRRASSTIAPAPQSRQPHNRVRQLLKYPFHRQTDISMDPAWLAPRITSRGTRPQLLSEPQDSPLRPRGPGPPQAGTLGPNRLEWASVSPFHKISEIIHFPLLHFRKFLKRTEAQSDTQVTVVTVDLCVL